MSKYAQRPEVEVSVIYSCSLLYAFLSLNLELAHSSRLAGHEIQGSLPVSVPRVLIDVVVPHPTLVLEIQTWALMLMQ